MKSALYAGSFDPLTLGHLDVIIRAARQCDRLVVGIGVNPNKKKAFLPVEERVALIKADCADRGIDNVTVESFTGATVDFAKSHDITTLIRGLRNDQDLDRERGLAEINGANGFETVFLLARSKHSHISSQLVREVITAGLSLDKLVSDRGGAALVKHGAIRQRSSIPV